MNGGACNSTHNMGCAVFNMIKNDDTNTFTTTSNRCCENSIKQVNGTGYGLGVKAHLSLSPSRARRLVTRVLGHPTRQVLGGRTRGRLWAEWSLSGIVQGDFWAGISVTRGMESIYVTFTSCAGGGRCSVRENFCVRAFVCGQAALTGRSTLNTRGHKAPRIPSRLLPRPCAAGLGRRRREMGGHFHTTS